MPITKDVNNGIQYTIKRDNWAFDETGVVAASQFAVAGDSDVLKQIQFDPNGQPTDTVVTIASNPAAAGSVTATLPATSGTLAISGEGVTPSFSTIQTPAGTSPVATSPTDVLTLSSTDLTITGNAAADSVTFGLSTVNSDVGSFGTATQVPTVTVNAKGLVTAASNTSIQIAESQVTNLVSDLAGKQATGNYMTALTGDVTASGPGSAAATVASVGGSTAAAVGSATVLANAATTANTANTIVLRDANGFSGSVGLPTSSITATKTANYPVGASDILIPVNTTGGSFTITLPSPATQRRIMIKDVGGALGTNPLTIARNGSESIEGLAANLIVYSNWGFYTLQSDGTNWFKVGGSNNRAIQTYTSSGTFTVPAGVTVVTCQMRAGSSGGAGGGAGGGGSTSAAAGGGGSGGGGGTVNSVTRTVSVTPGDAIIYAIGAGGTGGAGGTPAAANAAGSTGGNGGFGGAGGDTSFGSLFILYGGVAPGGGTGGTLAAGGAAGSGSSSRIGATALAAAGGNPGAVGGTPTNPAFQQTGNRAAPGAGGTSGANTGGGGAGAPGVIAGDITIAGTPAVVGGNGGLAGNGQAGNPGPTSPGSGACGYSGSGGGGGGIVAVTGSQGGAGGDGSAGNPGYITLVWQE